MSYRQQEEADRQAENRMINLLEASLAMMRPKDTPWLNLIAANMDEKAKNDITEQIFLVVEQLKRKRERCNLTMVSMRMIYPEFDPDKHYGEVVRDERDRITDFKPAKKDITLSKDIIHARDSWDVCVRYNELVSGIIRSLEIFADGLWELTGTALVQSIVDYGGGRRNYAIDKGVAADIAAEMFPDETDEPKDKEKDGKESKSSKKDKGKLK